MVDRNRTVAQSDDFRRVPAHHAEFLVSTAEKTTTGLLLALAAVPRTGYYRVRADVPVRVATITSVRVNVRVGAVIITNMVVVDSVSIDTDTRLLQYDVLLHLTLGDVVDLNIAVVETGSAIVEPSLQIVSRFELGFDSI